MLITRRKSRTSQPQQQVGVDWGNALTRGLLGTTLSDGTLLGHRGALIRPFYVGSGVARSTTPFGASYSFSGASTAAVGYNIGATVAAADAVTVEFLGIGSAFPSLAVLACLTTTQYSNGVVGGLGPPDDGGNRGILTFTGGPPCDIYAWGGSQDFDSNVQMQTGVLQHIVVVKGAGTGAVPWRVYRNGALVATGNSSNGVSWVSAGPFFYIGGRHDAGAASFTGSAVRASVWGRALGDLEVASLYRNPWQLLSGRPRRIWVPVGGGGISQAILQATETDTARAFVAAQSRAIGLATETDTAQPLTVSTGQAVAIGLASETDAARPLVAAQSRAIGLATETNTAQALRSLASLTIGRAAEADTAQALASAQSRAIGRADETDTAQPFTTPGNQALAIGLALEIDAAGLLTASQSRVIGRAVETDTAQPLAVAQARTIGLAQETDAAQALTAVLSQALAIGRATEVDTAQAFTAIGGAVAPGATAEEIWSYVLPTGLSAADTVSQIHAMLTALTAQAPCPTATQIADAVWAKELP